jgi:hypothetical protein
MARGTLTAQTSARNVSSAALTWTAANGTDKHQFANDGTVVLLVRNDHSSPQATIVYRPVTINGSALGNLTLTTANDAYSILGPFPTALYNQIDGMIYIDPPGSPTTLFYAVAKVGSL